MICYLVYKGQLSFGKSSIHQRYNIKFDFHRRRVDKDFDPSPKATKIFNAPLIHQAVTLTSLSHHEIYNKSLPLIFALKLLLLSRQPENDQYKSIYFAVYRFAPRLSHQVALRSENSITTLGGVASAKLKL